MVSWREAAGVTVEIPPPVCLALKHFLCREDGVHPTSSGFIVPNVGFEELHVGSGEEDHQSLFPSRALFFVETLR